MIGSILFQAFAGLVDGCRILETIPYIMVPKTAFWLTMVIAVNLAIYYVQIVSHLEFEEHMALKEHDPTKNWYYIWADARLKDLKLFFVSRDLDTQILEEFDEYKSLNQLLFKLF